MKQEYFYHIADAVQELSAAQELFTLYLSAEESDFVRFNHAKVRQPGSVSQQSISVRLIHGNKHVSSTVNLTGNLDTDKAKLVPVMERLRTQLDIVPADPHFLINTEVTSTSHIDEPTAFSAMDMVDDIIDQCAGLDMVGILANGSITKGFANSLGQRNWFHTHNFNFDWSFVENTDKAVKSSYAGQQWDSQEFQKLVDTAKIKLEALRLPPVTLEPGAYRVALSPGALWEILEVVAWGGFGLKSQKTKVSALLKLVEQERSLSPMFSLMENTKEGSSPSFQSDGFISPDSVSLVDQGLYHSSLVSPRSAKEFGVPTNGASGYEMPHSMDVAAGDIPSAEMLQRLGTGIDISNLWYLNFSDRTNCGITGMTRFATLWVEDGVIKGPVNPMRFDDTVYNLLGENLLGLTKERAFLLSASSYFERSTGSARLPGALIKDMRFTL